MTRHRALDPSLAQGSCRSSGAARSGPNFAIRRPQPKPPRRSIVSSRAVTGIVDRRANWFHGVHWANLPADIIEPLASRISNRARSLRQVWRAFVAASLTCHASCISWIEVNLDGLRKRTGTEPSLTRIIGGWLAKIVPEGDPRSTASRASRWKGVCWAPDHDSPGTAGTELVDFLQKEGHAPKGSQRQLHPCCAGQLERMIPGAHVSWLVEHWRML